MTTATVRWLLDGGDMFRFVRALRTYKLMKEPSVRTFLTVPEVAKGPNYNLGLKKGFTVAKPASATADTPAPIWGFSGTST